ncbi:unnamed protein product [Nippostrongylus brasiliensis]|uniref:Uncharacterized protein n=1 Tax=Nippostrongylus brasiliensis TaxID=27835 RepID=A0A0N4Y7M2_NIPBR|nr:unnamed protein product [Nippostrongylus brasiliensis]
MGVVEANVDDIVFSPLEVDTFVAIVLPVVVALKCLVVAAPNSCIIEVFRFCSTFTALSSTSIDSCEPAATIGC